MTTMEMQEYRRKLDELFAAYVESGFLVAARLPKADEDIVKNGIFEIHGRPADIRYGMIPKMSGTFEQHITTINQFRQHTAAGDEWTWPRKDK